ncbi:MAG: hypothetical protein KDD19_25485 [Phaeodactylibacter sp.]|nr:hypothetical protein [Phaeodactylibacter sp.]MCB9048224.1 hypothetical protein [Lewinellaceae bacterium]
MQTLIIQDESFAGSILQQLEIEVESERATVRDIITARVYAEVGKYNQKVDKVRSWFIGIHPKEQELNRTGQRPPEVDAEQQSYIALRAFQENRFFVFVDNRQVESLDEEFLLQPDTKVSFLKLTPLVGG